LGNSEVLGTTAEWSPACPANGIEADWSVLLTSDFSFDVVAGASLLGPAGAVPTGLMGVVELTVSATVGLWGADTSSFLQPKSDAAIKIMQSREFAFCMVDSCQVRWIQYHLS
jgi:hypothetical protein